MFENTVTEETQTEFDVEIVSGIEETGRSAKSGTGSYFPSLKIRGPLLGGFGAVCNVFAIPVGVTLWQVDGIATINKQIVELRSPTSAASLGIMRDAPGTSAHGQLNIRALLLDGDLMFHKRFNKIRIKNNKRFARLKARRWQFSPAQRNPSTSSLRRAVS